MYLHVFTHSQGIITSNVLHTLFQDIIQKYLRCIHSSPPPYNVLDGQHTYLLSIFFSHCIILKSTYVCLCSMFCSTTCSVVALSVKNPLSFPSQLPLGSCIRILIASMCVISTCGQWCSISQYFLFVFCAISYVQYVG